MTHGTLDVIERQNDWVDAVLSARRNEIREAAGILVFNDWRSVKGA